ncbi:MAG: sigma-70 family RNA polymerase sigma factor [Myxococcales bacterium]
MKGRIAAPPDAPTREAFEARVRSLCEAEAWRDAASLTIEGYGPELMGMLVALASPKSLAHDRFSEVCLALCQDLPGFRWRSSLRTWLYAIARHCVLHARRAPDARLPHLPLSQSPEIQAAVAHVRTSTAPYLRSEAKDQFAALRAELSQDEQMLLILRVDRNLGWRDVAEILEESEPALRKRFERLKARLVQMAKERQLFVDR